MDAAGVDGIAHVEDIGVGDRGSDGGGYHAEQQKGCEQLFNWENQRANEVGIR